MRHFSKNRNLCGATLTAVVLVASLALCGTPVVAQTISSSYCITGTSAGSGWTFAWEYDDGSTLHHLDMGAYLPSGATCADFAQTFVDSLNMVANPPGAYTASITSSCCFQVTMASGWNWGGLWVGPPGNPTGCLVTGAGCTFNPTIVLSDQVVPDEAQSWGRVKALYDGR